MAGLKILRDKATESEASFRVTDYPMHYFAAIRARNQENLAPKLTAIDLTPIEWRILATIRDRKRCTVNEIADVTSVDRFKVSRGLKALSEKGLVADDEDTADRRRRRSVLTADGERAYLEAFKIVRQVYLQNFDGISDEEFATLMRLLRRIKDNVFRTEAY
jgi:DNA-binding MarR family transcriptional regulator